MIIERVELSSNEAKTMIAELNAELSAMYPEAGATHFGLTEDDVAPGNGVFVCIKSDGNPVGCGALRTTTDAGLDGRTGELKRMYVARSVRGTGLGRALLVKLEDEARALDMKYLVLETGIRQHEALALYRNAGFTEIPAYGEYTRSVSTSVCMMKRL